MDAEACAEYQTCGDSAPGRQHRDLRMAKMYGCSGVQFWVGMFDAETIEKLHADGLFCNVFLAGEDRVESYTAHFEMGVDTVLTNYMDLAADYRKKFM